MLQLPTFHRDVIDERAVETFEIGYDELLVFLFDLGMTAGNRSVGNAKRGGSVASNHHGQVFNRKDVALKSSGNGSESRVHSNRVSARVVERPSLRVHRFGGNSS